MDKILVLKEAAEAILNGSISDAEGIIKDIYPFQKVEAEQRKYTEKMKMEQFKKDGFIDRYSGKQLVNPGLLKVLSHYMPETFPYHPHWKRENCHQAYWEYVPTIDHIVPVSLGGKDEKENWATTSMLHNSIKSSWTLEEIGWKLHAPGDYEKWDGLTGVFLKIVESDKELLADGYIRCWYNASIQ